MEQQNIIKIEPKYVLSCKRSTDIIEMTVRKHITDEEL